MNKNCAVILAAGEGTRMKSGKPKALAEVLFKPMLDWVLDAVKAAGIEDICIVTGHLSEMLCAHLDGKYETVLQSERLGTGHAVMQAKGFISSHAGGNVLILNGDAPLIDAETISSALALHSADGNSATVVSARVDNPFGYGRMVRGVSGRLERIVEQRDADDFEKRIAEVNSGAYWFDCKALLSALTHLSDIGRTKKEYYLTDAVEILIGMGKKADAFTAATSDVILGANDRRQLMELNELARKRVLDRLMLSGVHIPLTDGVIISANAKIGRDTEIMPGTIIKGECEIGSGCVIGPNTMLTDCTVGDGSTVNASQCEKSIIGKNVSVGPFARLRPNAVIGDFVRVGNFVEVKNSNIGDGTKLSHLSYIGDSDFGKGINVGCGCATANYDGSKKFRTVVGDNAFIGCDTCLVAPVEVGEGAYIAAGSVITDKVPVDTLAIARSRQVIKIKRKK